MREGLTEELSKLELRLLEPEVRADRQALEALLADDFIEFASSGGAYSRSEVITALVAQKSARLSASDFTVRRLSDDTALLTYRSTRPDGLSALRSSIWRMQAGRWRMIFHQGTPQA
jgi:hypothetical protein